MWTLAKVRQFYKFFFSIFESHVGRHYLPVFGNISKFILDVIGIHSLRYTQSYELFSSTCRVPRVLRYIKWEPSWAPFWFICRKQSLLTLSCPENDGTYKNTSWAPILPLIFLRATKDEFWKFYKCRIGVGLFKTYWVHLYLLKPTLVAIFTYLVIPTMQVTLIHLLRLTLIVIFKHLLSWTP